MGRPQHTHPGLPIDVVAYSGGRGEEEPRAILKEGASLEVREVLSRWREPSGRYFRVSTSDDEVHVLCCRESDGSWWLMVGDRPVGR